MKITLLVKACKSKVKLIFLVITWYAGCLFFLFWKLCSPAKKEQKAVHIYFWKWDFNECQEVQNKVYDCVVQYPTHGNEGETISAKGECKSLFCRTLLWHLKTSAWDCIMFQKCSVTKQLDSYNTGDWASCSVYNVCVSFVYARIVALCIGKESLYVRKKCSEGNIGVYCSILSI